ncbi:MAG: GNAT family N-acetyltransferase [Chloroflexota bacterium]|nr:GNAT family N-acetyltransferase [Chloroflexota bacterium]
MTSHPSSSPEMFVFPDGELPASLECQVLSFQRITWPEGFSGELRLRDWIHNPAHHPMHFVLAERGVLVSYVGVLWKHLQHAGETYKTYGLSGALTYPAFRRQGNARRLVDTATSYIRQSDADIGLFTCAPALRSFYSATAWISMDSAALFGGPRSDPSLSDELTMMGFFSEKGRSGRPSFEAQPIYFDDDLW